ncbi:IclR family transcriptional regulator [Roseobacter sp. HKCCA0434]|uniref:IclR family transcriptional regulator n=1 Tax=Roseobacter sp. HKCCA0434 TaxID=3079297 RepID=UPI002905C848|nr:IclR family transcriptional regulator C-terminal domain-containing protein [Roseobacter sp. HKCCA0434]
MTERTGQVRAVVRGLTLLQHIAESDAGLTLTDAADRADLPPSTTHRLLTTMEAERFVRFDVAAGTWQIGVAAFVTGAAFLKTRSLMLVAKPFLTQLVELTGETANVFVESNGEVVCLDQVESRHATRSLTQIGGRLPMHASGSGKSLLSHMSKDRRQQLLGSGDLVAMTPSTITCRKDLNEILDRARTDGFASDHGEHSDGMRSAASAVFCEAGNPIAALAVSGPEWRIDDAKMSELCDHVKQAARDVTVEFGGRAP